MTAHDFARQLLAGPDLPMILATTGIDYPTSAARIAAHAGPGVVPFRLPLGGGDAVDCLLIQPSPDDAADEVLDELDALVRAARLDN